LPIKKRLTFLVSSDKLRGGAGGTEVVGFTGAVASLVEAVAGSNLVSVSFYS
jgi:hypothetical protein